MFAKLHIDVKVSSTKLSTSWCFHIKSRHMKGWMLEQVLSFIPDCLQKGKVGHLT